MALSGLEIKMTFCRRAMYYVSNVALIMCIICTFVLTAWASDDVADRQAVDRYRPLQTATDRYRPLQTVADRGRPAGVRPSDRDRP